MAEEKRSAGSLTDNGYWEDAPLDGMRVDSAGHIFARRGRAIHRPEGRENYLLFYVARGEETFFLDGKKVVLREGELLWYAPRQPQHHETACDGVSEFYFVHFSDGDGGLAALLPFPAATPYRLATGGRLISCFQGIIDELQQARPYYREIALSKLYELLYYLRRRESEAASGGGRDPDMHRAIHEINRTYTEDITLDEYAARLGLSKYHFLRLFKQKTGLSPIAYRNRLRLRHAMEMLEDSTLSVAEIATAVGFSAPRYFTEAFTREVGISPAAYRKRRANP